MLEGFHALKHALRFGADVEEAYASDPEGLLTLATRLAPDVAPRLREVVHPIAPALFAQLAPAPPETGVIALARRPRLDIEEVFRRPGTAPVVLLEQPTHLGNLGAVVRVAAAAGAAAVLTTGRQDPWHPAALRGSAGLHFALPVARIEALPESDRALIAVDPAGQPIRPGAIEGDAVYAFGSERRGLSDALLERAELRIAIPMRAGVSSLNLATAVAVVLYAWRFGLTHTFAPGLGSALALEVAIDEADGGGADEVANPLQLGLEPLPAGARQAQPRLHPERAHDELARLPLGFHVQPADQAIAFEQRKDIVAVSAPLLGHEHLDPIVEAEQPGEALAVAQERIERVQDAKPLLWRRQVPQQLFDVRPRE